MSKTRYPNNIKKFRNSLGLTQKEVGNYLGISQSEFGRIENGHRRIGGHLKNILFLLNCSEEELIYQSDQKVFVPIYCLPSKAGSEGIQFDKSIETKVEISLAKENYEKIFCVFQNGDLMLPRFKHGDKLFCCPSSELKSGCSYAITIKDNHNEIFIRNFDSKLNGFISINENGKKEQNYININNIECVFEVLFAYYN